MFHRDGAPADLRLFRALTEALSYCGSDASGVWSEGPVCLGNARSATTWGSREEKQPLALGNRLWLTADARLDDRAQLIRHLSASGDEDGPSATDCELIARSYELWGAKCVEYLRGDFAFAIWDARAEKLFCARDHFGVKPFYYAQLDNLFLFSNALDCVRKYPEVSGELNDSAIADFLLFGLNYDEATTSFRDVQRLPPAHCLMVSREGLQMQRYWSPPANGRLRYRREAEYVEHFQTLLQAAVKDRLRTDRVGILLSGGLDSTSLAATAKELGAQSGGSPDIRTYTAVYESLIPDGEAGLASSAARFLGVPNRRIPMDRVPPFAWPDDPTHRLPEPPDNPFFGAMFEQFHAVAEDCQVLLSGEGNDNLMYFQMWPYVQDLIGSKQWTRLAKEGLQYLSVRPFPWRGIRARLPGWLGKVSAADSFPSWIAPDFAHRLNLQDRWRENGELLVQAAPHPVRPKAHASLALPHWARMFENENASVTRYPVDVRYPFLDLRLVEYLLALPPFPWFFQKALLRKAVAGKLPEDIRIRLKTPFYGDPLLAHFQRSDIGWVQQTPRHAELDRYINRGALPELHGKMSSEHVTLATRPHCLNFWLQSVRSLARRKLRVETC